MPPGPHRFDEQSVSPTCCRRHVPSLVRIESEGFLAQDMLAGVEGLDDPFGVLIICKAHVDDVDVRIIEEGVVACENAQWVEVRRALLTATSDRLEVCSIRRMHGRSHRPRRDPAGAEETPPDGHRLPEQLRHDGHAVVECRGLGGLHDRHDIA